MEGMYQALATKLVICMTIGSAFIALGVFMVISAIEQITNQNPGLLGRNWSVLWSAGFGLLFLLGGATFYGVAYWPAE